jgi:hypothetical protein
MVLAAALFAAGWIHVKDVPFAEKMAEYEPRQRDRFT